MLNQEKNSAELGRERLAAGEFKPDPAARWFTYDDGSVLVRAFGKADEGQWFPLPSATLTCMQCGKMRRLDACHAPSVEDEDFHDGQPLLSFEFTHDQGESFANPADAYMQVDVETGAAVCGSCFASDGDQMGIKP